MAVASCGEKEAELQTVTPSIESHNLGLHPFPLEKHKTDDCKILCVCVYLYVCMCVCVCVGGGVYPNVLGDEKNRSVCERGGLLPETGAVLPPGTGAGVLHGQYLVLGTLFTVEPPRSPTWQGIVGGGKKSHF